MKLPETLKPSRFFAKDRRGVALVTVLTVMALTTILVLTFFSLATSEHRASNTYSQGLQAQQVGEQAVNMVIAQIREATVRPSSEKTVAWASQPGAIRTWQFNGSEHDAYKLYSDDKMVTDDWGDFQNDFQDARNWTSQPEHFVDLNEPVIRGEKVYYPIVHPLASTEPTWPNRLGDDNNGVEGFRYNEGTDKISDFGPVGKKAADLANSQGHVAMPVRWIYQLADGTLGVLKDQGSGFDAFEGTTEPSALNPIVARFAFWADDETAKLNMNVHAGGLAWDIPKAGGELDMAMGKFQPAQKEYQRYPGHPATTHLIPALAPGVLDIVNDRDAMEMLFEVVPRIVGGGSESGTRVINTRDPKEMNGLIPDTEPLFPSLDDVIMRADRTPHEFPDARGKPIPADEMSEYLERAKFFVTVSSRAPETNMFNKPRIAIWPIYNFKTDNEYENYLTTFDRLIHFCSSMGVHSGPGAHDRYEYIFKRQWADSSTDDYEKIDRNKELYNYLLYLMGEKVPGYGVSFIEKYGKENSAQLITQIFDYIRTTNLHDDTLFKDFTDAFVKDNVSEHLTYTNPRDVDEKGFGHKGHGQVSPISIEAELGGAKIPTKGFGRFYSISGADIHVACVGQYEPGGALYPGVTQYNRPGFVEMPSGTLYTNLPPLPPGVESPADADKSQWPNWLAALQMTDPAQFNAAFDKAQWNWQLAFLDPNYRAAVLSNPSASKFKRELITRAGSDLMRLQPGERLVQASFLFNMFCPSIGWGSINPDMEVHIRRVNGMKFTGATESVGFLGWEGGYNDTDGSDVFIWATNWAKPHRQGGARSWGGLLSFGYMMSARQALQEGTNDTNRRNVWWQMGTKGYTLNGNIRSRLTPLDKGYDLIPDGLRAVQGRKILGDLNKVVQAYKYDLVTIPFKVTDEIIFEQGTVNFKVYNGGPHTENSARSGTTDELVQDVTMDFPGFSLPAPQLTPGFPGYIDDFTRLAHDSHNSLELASLTADPANPLSTAASKASRRPGVGRNPNSNSNQPANGNIGRLALLVNHWDSGSTYVRAGDRNAPGDVVQSICLAHGDARMAASKPVIVQADEIFMPHRDYGKKMMAHSLTNSVGAAIAGFTTGENKDYLIIPTLPGTNPYRNAIPLPFGRMKSVEVQKFGDFDNGSGTMIDGPYINKPDEGNVHSLRTRFTQEVVDYWESRRNYGEFPYFSNPELAEAGGPAYFSPNRLVSGPGMFGSLPTALYPTPTNASAQPWQTLLFRPNVKGAGYEDHPGAKDPPDHLIMDMFWMPIVEPYAISEPLSTAGKINLNYEIVPFLHVHRDTALRGVFRSEFMLCVPVQWHHSYKHDHGRGQGYHWRDNPYGGALQGKRLRTAIVEGDTLKQFDDLFDSGRNAFKSATQICDIHLVPEEVSKRLGKTQGGVGSYTPSIQKMANGEYWRDHALVGDNSRERPYTNIQNRITTKSNTFMVHYRAQVLKQARRDNDADYKNWNPTIDTVQAEYRGSSIVERYVDPNGDMPDFTSITAPSIDMYYRFRVINPRRFAP